MGRSMRVRSCVVASALLGLLVAATGCGGGGVVPADIAGTWVVVLYDGQVHPQEDFCFDVLRDGTAQTMLRTVGTCDGDGLLSLSFSGWANGAVTATAPLQHTGTGAGTWQRTVVSAGSGAMVCTRAAHQTVTGTYAIAYDGGGASGTTMTITADGYTDFGGLIVGVVGNGGALVAALRGGPGGAAGPFVLTGTLTATGVSGTWIDVDGNEGTWLGTRQ
jgi:hypothetical protein